MTSRDARTEKTFQDLLAPKIKMASRQLARSMVTCASKRIGVNKTTLHVESSKATENPTYPVLCLPGALGTAVTDFGPQLTQLPELNPAVEVIAFDPRGYGKSQPPIRDFPLNFLERDADDAKTLMDTLGYTKVRLH